jgi:hypothetical protein
MKSLTASSIERLISIEAHVHYGESPPPDVHPFIEITRNSSVLISAPHGSRAFRNRQGDIWHEEDEYTAGMALLLSERCGTSVIANIWRSDLCDPNWHEVNQCLYKQKMSQMVQQQGIRWVLDLHGAAENSEQLGRSRVDLGTREERHSIPIAQRDKLRELIVARFGQESVSLNGFPASFRGTVSSFCQEQLRIQAVQIEMKPSVRVPLRRTDASSYAELGPFSAPAKNVIAMLSALEKFIAYLEKLSNS